MSKTPYDIIGETALYNMIDHFYALVEKDDRINHLFPGDFAETSRKQSNFTQFLGGPNLYTEEHGHPMLKRDIWNLKITTYEKRCMVRKYAYCNNRSTVSNWCWRVFI